MATEPSTAEAGYVRARLAGDYTGCLRELLDMTVWLPVKGTDRQLIVTHRGDHGLVRAYTSRHRVEASAAAEIDPAAAMPRRFADLLGEWRSDELGLVINPGTDTELQLPRQLLPRILDLRSRMFAERVAAARSAWPAERVSARVGTFRFAALVDGLDTAGRPVLAPDRPQVTDPEEKDRLRAYLTNGEILQVLAGRVPDLLDPEGPVVVPANTLTDGVWVWQDGAAYYLDTYGIGPEREFYDHIVQLGYRCPEVSPSRVRLAGRALAEWQRMTVGRYRRGEADQYRQEEADQYRQGPADGAES